jgi:hypothetical protein
LLLSRSHGIDKFDRRFAVFSPAAPALSLPALRVAYSVERKVGCNPVEPGGEASVRPLSMAGLVNA